MLIISELNRNRDQAFCLILQGLDLDPFCLGFSANVDLSFYQEGFTFVHAPVYSKCAQQIGLSRSVVAMIVGSKFLPPILFLI